MAEPVLTMRNPLGRAAGLAFSFILLAGQDPVFTPGPDLAPAFVVVVNDDNPITTIDRDKLSNIFFKRAARWPDGVVAEPIDLGVKQLSRISFSRLVHRKTVSAVRAFWHQQIFSGREVPPAEKANERDVLSYVRDHAGAVGYISRGVTLPEGVKELIIKGIRP